MPAHSPSDCPIRRVSVAASLLLFLVAQVARVPAAAPVSPSFADLSLEELMNVPVESVVAASRYEQKVTRAPASVSIVTAEEIRRFGYRTPAEALRALPGLHLTYDRAWTFLGIRGFARTGDFNNGVLLLLDGHRVNDPIYNLMYLAHDSLVDLDTVDRMEVIRGPSSSIYGNNAFFGVINVVTRRGAELDGVEASAEAGSFSSYKARLAYGKKLRDGVDLFLSASYYDSAGHDTLYFREFDAPATNRGIAVGNDAEHAWHLFGRLTAHDFTFTAGYSDREKEIPTAPYGSAFNAGRAWARDARGYVETRYEKDLTATGHLLARVSYDWYPYSATWPYENATPPPTYTLNRDDARSEWLRAEIQWTEKFRDKHTLIGGIDYQDNLQQRQLNFDDVPFTEYLRLDDDSRSHAAYLQAELELHRQWLLNAGVRYDYYDTFGDTVNPRLGLIHKLTGATTLKALYGEAFRAPSDYELNFESGNNQRNPALEPETIRTYELVLEHYLPPIYRFSAAAYRYEIDGLITQRLDPTTDRQMFQNLGAVDATGAELQADANFTNGALARVSYALQHTEDRTTGRVLENAPRHLGKLHVSVPLRLEKLFASVELLYQSRTQTIANTTLGEHLLCNFTLLARALSPRWELSATVYNLFADRYRVPNPQSGALDSIEQDRRTFRVKFTHRF